ncbi:unnamed protein product [Rotaria magnacalcarata]|uniref:Uncharacterized protein n=1 Tax=Rotaria magnacalcarata TaxID=392030 RepID=A0A816S4N6_9BILA|nr:unnamed protein product [Rotaria magnacalcarata]
MTSTEPKLVSTNQRATNSSRFNEAKRLTTYLVVNNSQLHLVEVPDLMHKSVVFRNQAHRILEAIRLPGFSIGNQPILFSFDETNENSFKCKLNGRSSLSVTTAQTSSSAYPQQTIIPSSNYVGHHFETYTNDSLSTDTSNDTTIEEVHNYLAFSRNANDHHQYVNSSSLRNKKRQRSK